MLAEGTANVISNQPDYLVVNNNTQVRLMPSGLAAFITGQIGADGQCVEGLTTRLKRSTSSRPGPANRRGFVSTKAW